MKRIGADVQWQAWLGKTRRALNTELAQVLALKGQKMRGLSVHLGRKTVAADLGLKEKALAKRERQATQLDQAIEAYLHKS